MREFNTSGPCNPALHYTVMRPALMAEGKAKVQQGRYFTLFAPRQSGKTTYFQLLLTGLQQEGFTPIWISFESLKTVTLTRFYEALSYKLHDAFIKFNIQPQVTIRDQVELAQFLRQEHLTSTRLVLIIDEFEGIPDAVLGEVMHLFREIYHQKELYALHSLILVGVSSMAELVLTTASPFNVAEELQVSYFTLAEVHDLISQYVSESGQPFEPAVIQAIYDNSHGQPGLVNALCLYLVTKVVPDKSQPITMNHFYQTLQAFLTKRLDKNMLNIVQKARQKQMLMLKILFQPEPLIFSVYDADMAWLQAHGVIDEVEGYADVTVPLYKKVLLTAFRPLANGEARHYLTSAHETIAQYLTVTGGLNVNQLLAAYRAYIRRRGFQAFDTENLRESAWHYSLDGFITFFISQLGGQTYIEVPSGRGRIDILIRYQAQSYIIETKIFSNETHFKQGKAQLAAYLQSEGLAEGCYVVFSSLHTEADELFTEEMIAGKRIYTHIILINFDRPSRLPVPDELR